MIKTGIYINASCIIRHHSAEKNGQPVYEARHADLPDFLRGLYDRFSGQYPKFHKMDLLSKLGWAATEILLQDMPMDMYAPEDTGVILANASSSLDTDEKYFETVHDIASPALFVYTLPNIVIGEISIRHKFKGENAFFVQERFDTAFLTGYAAQLLESGAVKAVVCGWVEQYRAGHEAAFYLLETTPRGMALPFSVETAEKLYR
jgi:3-oxoacyl-(acyl-carrier-protein) synthase